MRREMERKEADSPMPHVPTDFSLIASPVILGVASLIAFVSVRSTSIADRVRSADKEIVEAATVPERRKNLLAQVHGLRSRYVADTYAMACLLIAFVAFVAMGVLNKMSPQGALGAFAVGTSFGVSGFILALYEVVTAKNTLLIDIEYAAAVARDIQRPNLPTGASSESEKNN